METIVIPARARTRVTPEKAITVSAATSRAIQAALACADEIDHARDRLSELATERADAIRTALEAGLSQADVGRLLGISGQAVHNILRQH